MNLAHKNIAFDVGNVLALFDMNKFIDELFSYNFFPTRERCVSFADKFQHHNDLGISTMSKELSLLTDDKLILQRIVQVWNDSLYFHHKMVELVHRLKNMQANIIIVSNMGEEHFVKLHQSEPTLFEGNVLEHFSCQVGARKPQKLFYQSLYLSMESAGLKTNTPIIFIDDLQVNLDGMVQYKHCLPYLFNLNKSLALGEDNLDKEINKLYSFLIE